MQDCLLGLDIGTRTVIGVVGQMEGKNLRILAQEMTEHESRSMIDGQIHDIPQVAEAVAEVKTRLEKKLGFRLSQAAVAAAGRALVTHQVHVEREIDRNREIDVSLVNSLELEGLKQAHRELETRLQRRAGEEFFCVGYSVVRYCLDQMSISNLVGHRGSLIGADVLAAFLPETVVNSLYAVLRRVGLEPVSLTLEPIAAMEVAIPPNLRLLNLALVDVGAGTSDIAISRQGTVVAYGMVPLAGDELTEAIMESFLLDFSAAELFKRSLRTVGSGGRIVYHDVLGIEHSAVFEEVMERIRPVMEKITSEVAAAILELNGGTSPSAVFCVGGGSQIPGFTDLLAEKLGLPAQRVAVRGRKELINLRIEGEDALSGPEGVTVIGIMRVAFNKFGHDFLRLRVNGQEFKLFNSRALDVGNAIALTGFEPRQLIARSGMGVEFILNGKKKFVPGEPGRPAEILLNGKPASLKTAVKDGDEIVITPAVAGKNAMVYVKDCLADYPPLEVLWEGSTRYFSPSCWRNDVLAHENEEVMPGDVLEISYPSLQEILASFSLSLSSCEVRVNGEKVRDWRITLGAGDRVEISPLSSPPLKIELNGREVFLEGGKEYLFVDLMRYLNLDLPRAPERVVLKLNGEEAQFTQPLRDGDRVEIYWE